MGLFSHGSSSGSSTPKTTSDPSPTPWKDRGKAWGAVAMEKGIQASDWVGGYANAAAEKAGAERFYPTSGDFPLEIEKAARILRAFTVDGVETTAEEKDKNGKVVKKVKVLRKIPPEIIKGAAGLVIFSSWRMGIAPFGGAGGGGVVVAKLDDGTWSGPSSISPNSFTVGFMLGSDVFDAVLVIRTKEALKEFATHTATLGSDLAVAVGPYGAGAAAEVGRSKAPVLTYVKSRGLYAGVQLVGQVFVERFDENAALYAWPGVKAGDILAGKARVPYEAKGLVAALVDAETGRAQTLKGNALDVAPSYTEALDNLVLDEGEVLKLPPTPLDELAEERKTGGRSFEDPREDELQKEDEERELPGGPSAAMHAPKSSAGLPPPPRRTTPATQAAQAGRRLPPVLPARDAHEGPTTSTTTSAPAKDSFPPPPPRRHHPLASTHPTSVSPAASSPASPSHLSAPLPAVTVPASSPAPPPLVSTLSTGFDADTAAPLEAFDRVSLSEAPLSGSASMSTAAATDPVQLEPPAASSSRLLESEDAPSYDKVMEEQSQTDRRSIPPPLPVVSDKKEELVL